MDLLDLWSGRMSWRRLGVLVRALAADPASRTCAVLDGPPSIDQFLLADLRESWSGIQNPWRAGLEKKRRTALARELVARQEAWNNRLRG